MANVLVANFLFTNAGVPIEGATVDLLARNTTTPVLDTTTTSAAGYWAFSYATEGRYDVRITNGSSVRWHMYDASAQFTALEVQTLRVRNPAFTFDYDIVPGAITADRQLNLPVTTGTDTLAVLGLAQTYSAVKTFSAAINLTSGQITFPASQSAAAGANVLDDYEEGTWTPTIGGTATYTTQIGRYVKIGKQVFVACELTINAIGTGSTTTVSGLPFASVDASIIQPGSIGYFASIATASTWLGAYVNANASTVGFANTASAVATAATDPVFANSARVNFGLVYEAAA